jgi:hypothetical protein
LLIKIIVMVLCLENLQKKLSLNILRNIATPTLICPHQQI